MGWGILLVGFSLAAALWLLLQSLWPEAKVGWAFALPTSAVTLFFGLLFLLGGRRLRQQGSARRQAVQLEAVRALVAHRRGAIGSHEVAGQLQLSEPEADALLSRLAREQATAVTLDVDDAGHMVYDFTGGEARWRVLEQSLAGSSEEHEAPDVAGQSAAKRGQH